MNEEIKKERSRNYPKMSLVDALELVKKLHSKAGKAKISPEVAVGALGYNGLNGAALGALGTLTQYGLIDRERGKSVSVSALAIKLIHPLNQQQDETCRKVSILMPQVFSELYSGGFHKCDESLIANHLIQNGFTTDAAKKVASVFIENVSVAKLGDDSIIESVELPVEEKPSETVSDDDSKTNTQTIKNLQTKGKSVLATYSVPLGSNEVQIIFTGESLRPDDFDALADYVALFKKQYQRKIEAEAALEAKDEPEQPEIS
jgi:hypothetical protein